MKLRTIMRSAFLFVLVAAMLGAVPAFAADNSVQADYNLYVSALPANQGDILTISAGDAEYTYAVSNKAVRGLDLSDTRSYAGDFAAVAGAESMMLALTDPACEGIAAEGSWKDSIDAADVTVTFNGKEQDFSGNSLELECSLGTLVLDKDGSITFTADKTTELVTISQSNGEQSCSVSLQRRMRTLPRDSKTTVVLCERDMDDWSSVPLPAGMKAIPESLSWNQYLQFSVANDMLFCRQTKAFPFKAANPIVGWTHTFTIRQSGGLTAKGNWNYDVRNARKYIRFNGAGHAFGTPDTVSDGVFALHLDHWYYTADDVGAGAFQFTSQQRGVELQAAVGRGELPELAAPGGEQLVIESNGRTITHTMQRLTHAEGNAPLESKLTVNACVVP